MRFRAPREAVYRALNDPERLGALVPGVERVEIADERRWTVHARIPLGGTTLLLPVRFERDHERPPEHARLRGWGSSFGTSLTIDTSFDLSEEDAVTEMRWRVEAHLGGPMGALGDRALRPALALQVAGVLKALERELDGPARREALGTV